MIYFPHAPLLEGIDQGLETAFLILEILRVPLESFDQTQLFLSSEGAG